MGYQGLCLAPQEIDFDRIRKLHKKPLVKYRAKFSVKNFSCQMDSFLIVLNLKSHWLIKKKKRKETVVVTQWWRENWKTTNRLERKKWSTSRGRPFVPENFSAVCLVCSMYHLQFNWLKQNFWLSKRKASQDTKWYQSTSDINGQLQQCSSTPPPSPTSGPANALRPGQASCSNAPA